MKKSDRMPWRFSPRRFAKELAGAPTLVKGIWMDLLVELWESNARAMPRTVSEWAGRWGVRPEEVEGLLAELLRRKLVVREEAGGVVALSVPMPPPRKRRARKEATAMPASEGGPLSVAEGQPAVEEGVQSAGELCANCRRLLTAVDGRAAAAPPVTAEDVDALMVFLRRKGGRGESWRRLGCLFAAHLTRRTWPELVAAVHRAPRGQRAEDLVFEREAAG